MKLGLRANQCPYCFWPYGRTYFIKACPAWKESEPWCEKGEIVLCEECEKWFFVKGAENEEKLS